MRGSEGFRLCYGLVFSGWVFRLMGNLDSFRLESAEGRGMVLMYLAIVVLLCVSQLKSHGMWLHVH